MNDNQMMDYVDEASKFTTSCRHYKLSSRLLNFATTFSGLDPFARNKGARRRTKRWNSRLRKHWTKLAMTFTFYLEIKVLTITLMRWIHARSRGDAQTEEAITRPDWIVMLIGDPFSCPPLPKLVYYLFIPSMAVWLKCYLPIYLYFVQPYDCTLVRFILEPEEEIRRFDLRAAVTLSDTIMAIEHRRLVSSYCLRFERSSTVKSEALYTSLSNIHGQLSQMRKVKIIRPKSLSVDWHTWMYKLSLCVIVISAVGNVTFTLLEILHFIWIAWIGRCCELSSLMPDRYGERDPSSPNCRLLDAFSFPDLLMLIEITLLLSLLVAVPSVVLAALQPLQVVHQLCLTDEISQRLRKLLDELRDIAPEGHLKVKHRGLGDQLVAELSADIISLWMFERETRKCVSMLTHGTRYAIVAFISFTTTMFASLRLQESLQRRNSATVDLQPALMGMFGLWCASTFQLIGVTFGCAIIPSRMNDIERTVFSLIAQLVRIQESNRSSDDLERLENHDQLFPADDPITSLWRRQALARSCDADRAAVCVFNTRLTYERVLSIVFYGATIISLLYAYIV